MAEAAHLDIETRSTVDLKTAGLYRYFEDASTEVVIVRWRLGDQRGNLASIEPFLAHIRAGGMVRGHNIAFDREGWNTKVAPTLRMIGFDAPDIAVEQTDCTQARCAALSVPQKLDGAGKALSLKITKDDEGQRLMLRMCKPKRIVDGVPEWHETPEQLARLDLYCERDVDSEHELDRVVPPLSAAERRVWVLDQKINARGVQLDTDLVDDALAVAEVAASEASTRIWELTDGAVERCTQTAKIVAWLNARGIVASSIAKGETEDLLLRTDLFGDDLARQVVELRRATAKSSVAKYRAMQRSVCADGRVRGTLAYHGASTGRWAGRLIQPQNLPRILDYADDVLRLHSILRAYPDAREAYAICAMMWDNPLEILSRALRSMIVAAPGHVLIGGDYSNIEGRVNAWLAGETWKVKAFAEFDAGIGHDLYVLSYGRAFGVSPENVDKHGRQQGKVMELALGYQGGVRAFQKMAAGYGMVVTDARADELKVAWRDAHPRIVESWYELQDAAIEAVRHPGMKVPCLSGRIQYLMAHGVLWCRLPSGRALSYVAPWVESGECKTCKGTGRVEEDDCLECWGRGEIKARVAFMGVDSATKRWGKQALYGGLQCENVVQAIARDILVEGMFRLEDAGYPLVLTVHDENLTEVPEGFGSPEELAALMSIVPAWAEGLPIAVSPWKDQRYVK